MFGTLFAKEWKEKAALLYFGLGILAIYLLACFGLAGKTDLLEWLTYALLLLFFPFAALLLGSSGFEAESRNDAWAYLFSRPIAKPVLWLVKYASLLGMLAVFWAVFAAMRLVVPGFGELVGGSRLLLGSGMEPGFPWLSLLLSVFLFTVAFSFSLLSVRPFSALFASLIVGVGLAALVYGALGNTAAGHLLLFARAGAQGALLVSLGLMSLAFAAGSILAFTKTDFSQPRKKSAGFAMWTGAFVFLALAATAAWAVWVPNPGNRFVSWIGTSDGAPFFATERGIFRCSETRDRIQWVAKGGAFSLPWTVMGKGKMAYVVNDIKGKTEVAEELWIADTDGSGRKRVLRLGEGGDPSVSAQGIMSWGMSPDGRRIAFIARDSLPKAAGKRSSLWVVDADGSGLTNLPSNPALGNGSRTGTWLHIVAWPANGKNILIYQRGTAKPVFSKLWLYDLEAKSARPLAESDAMGWCVPSPDQNFVSVPFRAGADGALRLGILDLRTLEMSSVDCEDITGFVHVTWNHKGDRFFFIASKKQDTGPDVFIRGIFSIAEKRIVAEREAGTDERTALAGSGDWLADDTRLFFRDGSDNSLRILDPDLREEKRIAFPATIRNPAGVFSAGNAVLIEDDANDSLWRFDLRKGSWKRIY